MVRRYLPQRGTEAMPYDGHVDTAEATPVTARAFAALDPAAARRRERDEHIGLDMLSNLERQAKDILSVAEASERPAGLQRFADCRKFRMKLGEFEAFCNVIESHLRKLAGDSRGELDELFHKRRMTILRPSVRALTGMFSRLSQDGLPFGLLDALDEELRALEGVRELVNGPESSEDDRLLLQEIDKLEAVIQSLRGGATEFEELTPTVFAAFEPTRAQPAVPAQAAATPLVSPQQRVVEKVRALLLPCRNTDDMQTHADSDLRALDDIERRLSSASEDRDAIAWLRDICKRWASRLREHNGEFIRLATIL
jgi:hypothetical protein